MKYQKTDDPEYEKTIREESDNARAIHETMTKYFRENMGIESLKHMAIVIITSPPDHGYEVNYLGNIERDELYFGLSMAKDILMKDFSKEDHINPNHNDEPTPT